MLLALFVVVVTFKLPAGDHASRASKCSRLRLITDQFFVLRPNSGVKRSLEETSEDEERLKEVVKLRQMKKALKKQKVQAKRGW